MKELNLVNKKREVEKVSNPDLVYHKALILLNEFDDVELDFSSRINKKYMIRGDFTNGKWIHFGDFKYEDFTKHQDEGRLNKFRIRNKHWIKKYDKYSPAWFSYYILW
jgi:hypothetical protein